ncbi:MAG: hypothetical protein ABSG90_15270, partial [Dehalococcoidia bacterium]
SYRGSRKRLIRIKARGVNRGYRLERLIRIKARVMHRHAPLEDWGWGCLGRESPWCGNIPIRGCDGLWYLNAVWIA